MQSNSPSRGPPFSPPDASPVFIDLAANAAAGHATDLGDRFSTAVIDATDSTSLATLDGAFDLIVADLVLMNLVDLAPLAHELPRLLAPSGRFKPTVLHPCFPSPFFVDVDDEGRPTGAISRLVGVGQRIAALSRARGSSKMVDDRGTAH